MNLVYVYFQILILKEQNPNLPGVVRKSQTVL